MKKVAIQDRCPHCQAATRAVLVRYRRGHDGPDVLQRPRPVAGGQVTVPDEWALVGLVCIGCRREMEPSREDSSHEREKSACSDLL